MDTWNKCETCLNSRAVVSENGIHHICCLSDKVAVDCMIDKIDRYEKRYVISEAKEVAE